eukprot:gnl/TRDRNA2_/TRDRNA2_171923_c0_seq3.p1 gnl/TRDRNA2_/TRDRNA2_171923_c0~~gnl/TRDRNA2_/TRDRNA2_171923_c0_seq3.p1  ORF type:complete len:421 (+),score=24.95 gnl/TRDRNA2_/TRDRNA2_171923_c0_seq3:89-1351(+)
MRRSVGPLVIYAWMPRLVFSLLCFVLSQGLRITSKNVHVMDETSNKVSSDSFEQSGGNEAEQHNWAKKRKKERYQQRHKQHTHGGKHEGRREQMGRRRQTEFKQNHGHVSYTGAGTRGHFVDQGAVVGPQGSHTYPRGVHHTDRATFLQETETHWVFMLDKGAVTAWGPQTGNAAFVDVETDFYGHWFRDASKDVEHVEFVQLFGYRIFESWWHLKFRPENTTVNRMWLEYLGFRSPTDYFIDDAHGGIAKFGMQPRQLGINHICDDDRSFQFAAPEQVIGILLLTVDVHTGDKIIMRCNQGYFERYARYDELQGIVEARRQDLPDYFKGATRATVGTSPMPNATGNPTTHATGNSSKPTRLRKDPVRHPESAQKQLDRTLQDIVEEDLARYKAWKRRPHFAPLDRAHAQRSPTEQGLKQ